MERNKYIKFFRNRRGYFFKGGIVTVGRDMRGYFIQMTMNRIGTLTIYKGLSKPLFRNIWVLHLFVFTYTLLEVVALAIVFVGGIFHLIGRLSMSISERIWKLTESNKFPQ